MILMDKIINYILVATFMAKLLIFEEYSVKFEIKHHANDVFDGFSGRTTQMVVICRILPYYIVRATSTWE